ncbi:SHOCT domain-containing protein [Draconibacterium mangrovi]|uniref:SHOCT domain-containing protein n=1 Tax=Draconibacterium mangrovi TaxID=2697469 RepID=UPI0013D8DA3C|nr:SHOCT domain-containing protein [Draconibacterium mangrovi]
MKKITISFYFLVVILFVGCATAKRINSLSPGMTKESVISAMGEPNSSSVTGNTEYLHYKLSETSDDALYGFYTDYYVKVVNGKVDSYGRLGDFNTTKDPTVNINTTSKTEQITNTDKMYDELNKLRQLLDNGTITQSEFNKKKQEILDRY